MYKLGNFDIFAGLSFPLLAANKVLSYPQGGRANLTCQWYRVVPFLGYHFRYRFRIYGYGFNNVLHFPDLWV